MVRQYVMSYEDSFDSKESMLVKVEEYGADATAGQRATGTPQFPVTYDYSTESVGFQSASTWATLGGNIVDNARGESSVYFADFSGDGKDDVLYCSSISWFARASTGSGFAFAQSLSLPYSCNIKNNYIPSVIQL